ncbi:MAG TPA: GntR family transcriptional regulator [Pseudonocardia sp.]|jgi:DNA-binding GntR family transcriptional regulator
MSPGVNGSTEGRPPLLSERAYTALRDRIVTLDLRPGSPINEERLSAELGVGRTPLRDAIKRLEAENLVLIYPRQGTFVAEVNISDHALIADVRRQLEGHAAGRAAERLAGADRSMLAELTGRVRDRVDGAAEHPAGHHPAGDREASMRLDTEIHRAVYRCARNRYLAETLDHYYNLSLRIWYLFLDRLPEVDHAAHHLPMLEAILDGHADTARELAVTHVDAFERSVRAAL